MLIWIVSMWHLPTVSQAETICLSVYILQILSYVKSFEQFWKKCCLKSLKYYFQCGLKMSSRQRKCKNDLNSFCYICELFTLSSEKRSIYDFGKKVYLTNIGVQVCNSKVCNSCVIRLWGWIEGKWPFNVTITMIRREPTSYVDDCYFWVVKVFRYNAKNKT